MKRLLLTIFILTTLIYATGCKETIKDPEEGYFKGRVVDSTGNPIDSVHVATFPPHMSTYTNANGYFQLRVFPRVYKLLINKGKFFVARIETVNNEIDTMNFGVLTAQFVDTTYDTTIVIDTTHGAPDTFTLALTIVQTIVDSSFYESVTTDSIDLQPGQIYDYGDITMDTFDIIGVISADTIQIDTLQ